jgi:poly-gamma-glutamate biosynthesis protein PgsC/CapC
MIGSDAQYYHPELVRMAFVLGIVVSILFYERRHLTTGGIAVPGYLGFVIFQPLIVPAIFAASWLTYMIIHKGLTRVMLVPDAAKFSLAILTSSALHFIADFSLVASGAVLESSPLLRGIGYVVPGLIAHDFARHGIRQTSYNIGVCTALVASVLAAAVFAMPELGRLQTSPIKDVFPITLGYLPLLIFVSLIAWIGVVRVHGLRCGGFLGGAYLTLLVLQPYELARFVIAALMTLAIVRWILAPGMILFGRRAFAAHMLVGAMISWGMFRISELYLEGDTISVATPSLAVLGVLLTGLISHDMDKAGVTRTLFGAFLSVAYTLCGTLLLLEAVTYQRPEIVATFAILFIGGTFLMALTPARLSRILRRMSGRPDKSDTGDKTHA